MRRWLAPVLGTLISCASLGPRPDDPVFPPDDLATILPGESPACTGDGACCEELGRRMQAARDRGDDEAADLEAERLALSCPQRRPFLLAPGRGGPNYPRKPDGGPHIGLGYQVRLEPRDHLTWAGIYFRGARVGNGLAPGAGDLTATFHIIAGEGPDAGRAFTITARQSLTLTAKQAIYGDVVLERVPGTPPFAAHFATKVETQGEGTIGVGGLAFPASPELARDPARFDPPPELRQAAAPFAILSACPKQAGPAARFHLQSYIAAPHLHPRHLAAALEWLRRLDYEAPTIQCDDRTFHFEAPSDPPSGINEHVRDRR